MSNEQFDKHSTAAEFAAYLKDCNALVAKGPGSGYRERRIEVQIWDICDAGGENVDEDTGFTLDPQESNALIAALDAAAVPECGTSYDFRGRTATNTTNAAPQGVTQNTFPRGGAAPNAAPQDGRQRTCNTMASPAVAAPSCVVVPLSYIDELERRATEQREWEQNPKCEDNGVGDTMQVIANELRVMATAPAVGAIKEKT